MDHNIVQELRELFSEYADADSAAAMEAYMKGIAPFFGIKTELRRTLLKHYLATMPPVQSAESVALARLLYAQPQREFHYTALELLQRMHKQWRGDELALFEQLIQEKSWWDTVDVIATKLVAPYLLRFPDQRAAAVNRWIHSPDMWLRRTALIFQNPYKHKTDEDLLYNCIRMCAHDGEFFIRKGIGWALREWAKTSPESVTAFVASEPLSALCRREAMKHLG